MRIIVAFEGDIRTVVETPILGPARLNCRPGEELWLLPPNSGLVSDDMLFVDRDNHVLVAITGGNAPVPGEGLEVTLLNGDLPDNYRG